MADQEKEGAASETPAAAAPPPPKFVGGPPRSRTVTLTYPVEYDGKVYRTITVTRMTVAQVRDFTVQVSDDPDGARLPMFDAPKEVMDALDPDDYAEVDRVVLDFLPRNMRAALEPTDQDGETTSPSSRAP